MAYKKFTGLKNAAEIMVKISETVRAAGWAILTDNMPDDVIDGSGTSDGKRLAIKSPDSKLFATFRSANGKKIFTSQKNESNAYGIGLVCSTAYTQNPASGLWFNQPNAPIVYGTDEVIGVGIPVNPNGSHTLYINLVTDPAHMLIVSVESGGVYQHLACGLVDKLGNWDGGAIFSGSRNSFAMFTQSFETTAIEAESSPLFGMDDKANTFLRADIDGAPTRRPGVLWASSGNPIAGASYAYTGKQLGLPVKNIALKNPAWMPRIPDFTYLQSQTTTDSGRNVNTLNCISVNEPQTVYVLRDPDERRNFSPAGYVSGVYFVSLKNVAPGQVYEINYPESGNLHQVFPYTRRKGIYGYDGFSVKQE